jgi:sulfopyruvate decarboxylase TPP-binding subunit
MKNLLKDKAVIISTSDCEIDFLFVVEQQNRATAINIIEQQKKLIENGSSDYEMLSDAVYYALEDASIEFTMPDFDEV